MEYASRQRRERDRRGRPHAGGLVRRVAAAGLVVALAAVAEPATAASLHTDATGFFAALPGPAITLDFEGVAAGSTIPNGGVLGEIAFEYALGGDLLLAVQDLWDATSGTRALGVADPGTGGQLIAGDEIGLAFRTPVLAVGLYVIASDPLEPADVRLTAGGHTASSGAATATLPDGGLVYFVGVVADGAVESATLGFAPGAIGTFLYTVDDLTTVPVPEPSSLALHGAALVLLARCRRCARRRAAEETR